MLGFLKASVSRHSLVTSTLTAKVIETEGASESAVPAALLLMLLFAESAAARRLAHP